MWFAKGELYHRNNIKFLLPHRIPTMDGQSGSPLIKEELGKQFAIGIHLGGDIERRLNAGVRITG